MCDNIRVMPKTIEIKDVPDELHRKLVIRAAKNGMTLSEYILSEIGGVAKKPTMEEWLEVVSDREPVKTSETSAEIIRRHRDGGYPEELG